MKNSLLAISFILCSLGASAQIVNENNYPIVGKPCPDFVLRNICYYSKKQANLKDFRDKWLILDFWNKHCGACVGSFPKVSKMQKKFGDKVQFMMVGIEDREGEIEPMFAKFRLKEGLAMPCAFDSLLANRFDIYTSPYIIVLDEKGVVQAITGSLDSTDIQGFLSGKPPEYLRRAYRVHEDEIETGFPFNNEKAFLIEGNGASDTDFIFRSVLTSWNPLVHQVSVPSSIDADSMNGRFQVLGVPLFSLYNYAYFGVFYPQTLGEDKFHSYPILEMHDSSLFIDSSKRGKNLFCYSLIIPAGKASKRGLEERMQRDLKNYFEFDARIEKRNFPCWRLVATAESKNKLATKGGPVSISGLPHANFKAINWPFSEILNLIRNSTDQVVLDETGIVGNIDISMDCIDTDFNDVKRACHLNGLDLVPGEKEMQVLVISDKISSE
jgi:thiol-disulfide isomerase/thioredoxin